MAGPSYASIKVATAEEAETSAPAAPEADFIPFHVGGGQYELSNGTRVKGKAEAIQAEYDLR